MNSSFCLSENIRTNCAGILLRNVSLESMHNILIDLFVDRNKTDTTLARFFDDEVMKQMLQYHNCLELNDKETIAFNQSCKQADFVFDEKRQIWVSGGVDTEKDDLFIPRDDAQ